MSRIQSDAEELEKALSTFVLEVQRTQHAADGRPLKRLMGAFSTADLGLGLIGAGAAGAWKGFGWVPLANEHDLPKRLLTPDLTVELASLASRLDEKTTSFSYTLRVDESSGMTCHGAFDVISNFLCS
jgi:son of sevenless-like protein